ncbi:MAG: hypothetical protein QOI06_3495 [Nocardioidaceae bacterium]|jgi:short-subunit dehydrogenase|nr:hypothetical protein [Nocardioidaceae bacterium]
MAQPRVVPVTGASSGIGRATALILARQGHHLLLMARGRARLEEVAAECLRRGAASASVRPGGVADERVIQATFDDAVATFGRVDAVVHSAGVAAYGRFVDIPADILQRVMDTNLTGTANVGRVALRRFESQGGGHAVFIGSLLGKIVAPQMSPYATSKWAVHALVRTMQIEARQTPGVEVSLVTPGSVDTPIYGWAASVSGRRGQPPPPVDTAEKAARAVVNVLDRPRREVSVGLANPLTVLGFRFMPALFDRLVTPIMGTFGLDPKPAVQTDGNLFESLDPPETSYGQRDPAPVRVVRRVLDRTAAVLSRTS